MNVMGKILVVLNLLFALAVGAFLIFDFGIRTDWRQAFLDQKKELEVVKINTDELIKTNRLINQQLSKKEQEVKDWQKKFIDKESEAEKYKQEKKQAETESKTTISNSTLTEKNLQKLNESLVQEAKDLKLIITKNTETITQLLKENKEMKADYVSAKENLSITQRRNEFLLKQIRDLSKTLALEKVKRKESPTDAVKVRISGGPNPPSVNIEAKIAQVSKTGNLVQLEVGSDAGLQKGHTLDVIRLATPPQYLGMIRIVEVGPMTAVAQRVNSGQFASKIPIRVGDTAIPDVLSLK